MTDKSIVSRNYRIIIAADLDSLTYEVDQALNHGWYPAGGPFPIPVSSESSLNHWGQAIVFVPQLVEQP